VGEGAIACPFRGLVVADGWPRLASWPACHRQDSHARTCTTEGRRRRRPPPRRERGPPDAAAPVRAARWQGWPAARPAALLRRTRPASAADASSSPSGAATAAGPGRRPRRPGSSRDPTAPGPDPGRGRAPSRARPGSRPPAAPARTSGYAWWPGAGVGGRGLAARTARCRSRRRSARPREGTGDSASAVTSRGGAGRRSGGRGDVLVRRRRGRRGGGCRRRAGLTGNADDRDAEGEHGQQQDGHDSGQAPPSGGAIGSHVRYLRWLGRGRAQGAGPGWRPRRVGAVSAPGGGGRGCSRRRRRSPGTPRRTRGRTGR
jgi:hypothetical protein